MDDLHRLSVAGLLAAYRAHETTPTDVVEWHFGRIDALDANLNAYVDLDREGAYQAAAESEARLASAAPRLLEGVPVAIKTNIAVRGLEWAGGMDALRGRIAEKDAKAVHLLRQAGAIVLGTLNMHEAALGATTDNPFFGRTTNPHREGRTPGGSSGGSGAAVAAGLCTIALGTDTLGSVRIPAAYNGVYGLKPGENILSLDGLEILREDLDAIGPLARSLDDIKAAALALGLVSGAGDVARRVVTLADLPDVEPAVRAAYQQASAFLTPDKVSLDHSLTRIRLAGFYASSRELGDRTAHLGQAKLSDNLRFLLDLGRERATDKWTQDRAILAATRAQLRDLLMPGTMLLLPTAPQAAFQHGDKAPADQADFTALANIAGLPAISIPAGLNADNLPVAIQLIGAPESEADLIETARQLHNHLSGYTPPPCF